MARTSDPHSATLKAWETRTRANKPESEGLGTWTPEGKWIPNDSEATRAWGRANGIRPTDAPVPFRVWDSDEHAFHPGEQDWWHGFRSIDKNEPAPGAMRVGDGPMLLNTKDLIATQHTVRGPTVERLAREIKAGTRKPGKDTIVVVKVGSKLFLYDGHHRATVGKALGQTQMLAHVFEVPTTGLGDVLTNAKF